MAMRDSMEPNALLEVQAHPQAVVVKTDCREFNMASTAQLKNEISDVAQQHAGLPVVFDMASVDFMASMTLGTLVELTGMLKKRGQGLILTGVNSQIQQVMEISALHRLFDIRSQVSDLVN